MNLWWTIKSRGGVATMAIGVLLTAGLATAVPVLTRSASDQQPAGEVYVAPTSEAPAAATTEPPAPAAEVAPVAVEQPAATSEPATVQTVTEPQAPEPQPQPATPVDPESIGSTGTDGYYTPAPPRVNPGEPPVGNIGSSEQFGGGAEPLPGEPGYVGDTPVLKIPPKN